METECSLEKLKKVISISERLTGKNLNLPVLNSIFIKSEERKIIIKSTNLEVGAEFIIPAITKKDGIISVSGGILSNFLSNIYNGEQKIILKEKNGSLVLDTGNSSVLIKGVPCDDFPTIPRVKNPKVFKINSQKLVNGIQSVIFSVSTSDIKPEIASVYIYSKEKELFFVATDSFRLSEKKIKLDTQIELEGVLIPFRNATEIIKMFENINEEIDFSVDSNQISIASKDYYFTSRIIDGNFPDYNQIIPKEHKTEAIILKQDILNSLKLSNIFSDKFNKIEFLIYPTKKVFKIISKNSDVGESKINLEASLSGDQVEINFNHKYLLSCFPSINQDSLILQFNGSNKPLIIKGVGDGSFTYLLMPLND